MARSSSGGGMSRSAPAAPKSTPTTSGVRIQSRAAPIKSEPVKTAPTKTAPIKSAERTTTGQVTRGQMQAEAAGKPHEMKNSTFKIPRDLVEKAQKWTNKTFGSWRRKMNKELAQHPEFKKSGWATEQNLKEMKAGRNPYAPKDQQVGKRKKIEYDHKTEIQQGKVRGNEKLSKENQQKIRTAANNITPKTPKAHMMKISKTFNDQSGADPMKSPNLQAPQKITKPAAQPKKLAAPATEAKNPMSAFRKIK